MSTLGKFLDPLADKLIVTAVLVYMVALGRGAPRVVVVLIARDLAVNGLRSIASAQGLVISASDGGKIKTALQLVAIMMLLIHFRYPLLGTGRTSTTTVAGRTSFTFDGRVAVFDASVHAALPVGGVDRSRARPSVIAVPAARSAPAEAARRAAAAPGAFWLSTPAATRCAGRARSGRRGAHRHRSRRHAR